MKVAESLANRGTVTLAVSESVPGLLIDDFVDVAVAVIEIGVTSSQYTVDPPFDDAVARSQ